MADLVVQESYHLHAVDGELQLTPYLLTVQDAIHRFRTEPELVLGSFLIWTDTLNPPKLPVLTLSAEFGKRIYCDSNGLKMPGLTIDARAGARSAEGLLPVMALAATATHETIGQIDSTLPALGISASSGLRCGVLKLPAMTVAASSTSGLLCHLNKKLPAIKVVATAYGDRTGVVDGKLPAIESSITIQTETLASLSRKLPALKISATAEHESQLTLDGKLPALQMAAHGAGGYNALSAYIPPLIMAAIGSVVSGHSSVLENTSRYDNFVLRHVR